MTEGGGLKREGLGGGGGRGEGLGGGRVEQGGEGVWPFF